MDSVAAMRTDRAPAYAGSTLGFCAPWFNLPFHRWRFPLRFARLTPADAFYLAFLRLPQPPQPSRLYFLPAKVWFAVDAS